MNELFHGYDFFRRSPGRGGRFIIFFYFLEIFREIFREIFLLKTLITRHHIHPNKEFSLFFCDAGWFEETFERVE